MVNRVSHRLARTARRHGLQILPSSGRSLSSASTQRCKSGAKEVGRVSLGLANTSKTD